jgi:hypothetical protein
MPQAARPRAPRHSLFGTHASDCSARLRSACGTCVAAWMSAYDICCALLNSISTAAW